MLPRVMPQRMLICGGFFNYFSIRLFFSESTAIPEVLLFS